VNDNDILEMSKTMAAVLAPIFLVTGIAALLNIMTVRFGRVVDRVRAVLKVESFDEHLRWELRVLYGRAKLLRAIIICASSAIFCIVLTIVLLFLAIMMNTPVGKSPLVTFMLALLLLVVAVALFIQDYALSLRVLRADVRRRLDVK